MRNYNFTKFGLVLVVTLVLCSCNLVENRPFGHTKAPRECYLTCESLGWYEKHFSEEYLQTLGLHTATGMIGINVDGTLYLYYHTELYMENGHDRIEIDIRANTGSQFELNRKYYFRKKVGQEEFYIQASATYVRYGERYSILTDSFLATDGYFEITNVEYDQYEEPTHISGNFVFTAENESLGKIEVSGGRFENQIINGYNYGNNYELELTANADVVKVNEPITFTAMQGKDEASMVDVTGTCVIYEAQSYNQITNPFIPTEAGVYSFYAVKGILVSPAIWVTVE